MYGLNVEWSFATSSNPPGGYSHCFFMRRLGDLVYKFKRIVGKPNFSDQFKKIVKRYKKGWI